ncbi:MAG: J domain-containing protein [Candidatus Wolfebacteria bacterium]|nr:J domain-containing protein [Candidatus Wolfebacteria bacterium]
MKQKRRTYSRGSDIQLIREISLEEAFRGIEKDFRYQVLVACEKCKGVGHDAKAGFNKCSVCDGRGEIRETRKSFFGNFEQVKRCGECKGAGQIPKKICEVCKGAGRVRGERSAKIEIRPGVQDGQIIKIKGAGEAGERGAEGGDLYAVVRIKPHPVFERRGDDLVISKEIKITDLLLENKLEIPSLSGNKIKAEIPAGWDLRDDLRIAGEGMPKFGSFGRGNLIIRLKVKAPKKVSAKAKKILGEIEKELE